MQRRDSDHHSLRIQHTLYPAAYLLRLIGDTHPTSHELAAAFQHADAWALPLIVDLSALGFGDEELLRRLLHAHRTGLTLIGPISDSFQRRLDTTGVTDLFTVRPTLDAALDSPGRGRR
ncbi:anti-sigma factor antagonist [Streptomyces californicus]|uniref:sulfate transporter n=1 Tax=Streptomyces TaxID=1883 RepID=UPI000BF12327|nr:sulfate transporter [Streptomyces sp. sk226]